MSKAAFLEKFPFKTLIWAITIFGSLFLFKNPIENILFSAGKVDVEILGLKLKVDEGELVELKTKQEEYLAAISELTVQIEHQDSTIIVLNTLQNELQKQVRNCTKAKDAAKKIDQQLKTLQKENSAIRTKSEAIKDVSIFSGFVKPLQDAIKKD